MSDAIARHALSSLPKSSPTSRMGDRRARQVDDPSRLARILPEYGRRRSARDRGREFCVIDTNARWPARNSFRDLVDSGAGNSAMGQSFRRQSKASSLFPSTSRARSALPPAAPGAFFEKFVTAEDNLAPARQFQEDPSRFVAHRTSPTNIGTVSSYDNLRARLRMDRAHETIRAPRRDPRRDESP